MTLHPHTSSSAPNTEETAARLLEMHDDLRLMIFGNKGSAFFRATAAELEALPEEDKKLLRDSFNPEAYATLLKAIETAGLKKVNAGLDLAETTDKHALQQNRYTHSIPPDIRSYILTIEEIGAAVRKVVPEASLVGTGISQFENLPITDVGGVLNQGKVASPPAKEASVTP